MIANTYPTLNFDLGEPADMIRETVRNFARNEIAPRAAEIDRTDRFPRDLERAIQKNGDLDTAAIHNLGAWVPYALLSGLGLVGFIAGIERFLSHTARPMLRESDAFAGPVLALGGGFLFLIASYYLYRALTRQD